MQVENTPDLSATVSTLSRPREWWVRQRHAAARDGGPGTKEEPLQSISAAAALAMPGDTVLIDSGVYREHVSPARGGEPGRPVTYQAAPGAHPVLRGSDPVHPEVWQPCPGAPGLWQLPLSSMSAPEDFHPFRLGLRNYQNPVRPHPADSALLPEPVRGQLFVNGILQKQLCDPEELRRMPGHWTVDPDGAFLLFHPPASARQFPHNLLVECSTRHRIFAPATRHLGHIHLRNLTFEHCANNHPTPQIAAVSVRAGHHWVIEGCTIRHANTVGLDLGTEWGIEDTPEAAGLDLNHPDGREFAAHPAGDHLVRGNVISDNGLCGVMGMHQYRTRFVENILERNNALGFRTFEIGAVKFHFFFDGVIERNLIRDNDAYGIWLDNRYAGSRVTRNLILNNYVAGVFIEMGLGPVLIDHNIIAYTRNGDGIYAHDASGLTIAHNLLYANAHTGVNLTLATDRKARDRQPVRCSHNRILNNIIAASKRAAISLPVPWERALDNHSDGNAFMGGGNPMDEGSGPDEPLFHLNRLHSRIPAEEALTAAGPAAAPLLAGAGAPLPVWQQATGRDLHSRIFQARREILASYGLHMDTVWDPEMLRTLTQPVPELPDAHDYLGETLPPDSPLPPGPFRRYFCGTKSKRSLWPAPSDLLPVSADDDAAPADPRAVWNRLSGLNSTGI